MDKSWQVQLKGEFEKPYFRALSEQLKKERETSTVYPPSGEVFTAFSETPFQRVKCVILGQDPYHGEGQAHGMSFSVKPGVRVPPSLANIYKELESDLGFAPVKHGYLRAWARQGVFLLNSVLTVRKKEANSHQGLGWELFTDRVIQALNERKVPVVFLLWGSAAKKKVALVNTGRHVILSSAHPSPMSASSGFFESKPFSKVNAALTKLGVPPINWQLPEDPLTETPSIEDLPESSAAKDDEFDAILAGA